MAGFRFNGIDGIEASYEQLSKLDDDTRWSIISAGAEVVRRYHEQQLRLEFKRHTGQLSSSPSIHKKRNSDGLYARIYPEGSHGQYSRKKVTRVYKNSKHGRTYTVGGDTKGKTNAEIAYILEYGSPRIEATHWMEKANEFAEPELMQAEADAWDAYLKSINL